MAINKFFFPYESFSIKDGLHIRLCEHKWFGNATLREQYPSIYNIVHLKSDTLAKVMKTSPPNITLRQDLVGPRIGSYNVLLQSKDMVQLMHGTKKFLWNLHKSEQFSV
jgi:hypothetical protein